MEDFKSNSHRSKAIEKANETLPEKRVEKVVTGTAKTKKQNGAKKFASAIISEEASNVKNYVLGDVLIPAIKKAISDIVRDGIDMILYGDAGRNRGNKSSGNYVAYSSYASRDRRDDRDRDRARTTRMDFEEVTFENRADAERVLMNLQDIVRKYGYAKVGDLFDLANLPAPYTSYNYGWANLDRVGVKRLYNGDYVLDLPRYMMID